MPLTVVPVEPCGTEMGWFVGPDGVHVTVIAKAAGIVTGPPVELATDLITLSDPTFVGLSQVSVFRTVTVVVPPAVIATGWAGEYAVVHDAGPRQPSAIAIGKRRSSDTAH